jgi:hypothetical protein
MNTIRRVLRRLKLLDVVRCPLCAERLRMNDWHGQRVHMEHQHLPASVVAKGVGA